LGALIKGLISIVSYSTFRKWVQTVEDSPNSRPKSTEAKPGRFLKRHAETMWQCDFACKRKWTVKGMGDVYFLVFIHLGSRRIWISPSTDNPTGDWTSQQARNFQMHIDDNDLKCTYLCRDNDTKYVKDFDAVFTSSNCKIGSSPIQPGRWGTLRICLPAQRQKITSSSKVD
jgi:hypothetical protein